MLAGSIRDDGPLPEVLTDVREAQNAMRAELHGAEMRELCRALGGRKRPRGR